MKNKKLFWPIGILCVIVIAVSIMSLSQKTDLNKAPVDEVVPEAKVSFTWENEEKPVLLMKANEEIAIDAIDLYIGYKGLVVDAVTNLNELPEASFSTISTDTSLVVLNYLISEVEGFKMSPGQVLRIVDLDVILDSDQSGELSIDPKTLVVETEISKVLPYTSENLMINSTL